MRRLALLLSIAIIVATCDEFHVPLCAQAVAAGKHVLVEKPLGVSIEECESLRDQLRPTGLVLAERRPNTAAPDRRLRGLVVLPLSASLRRKLAGD